MPGSFRHNRPRFARPRRFLAGSAVGGLCVAVLLATHGAPLAQQASEPQAEQSSTEAEVVITPAGGGAAGAAGGECASLPGHDDLVEVLQSVVTPGDSQANGGLGNHMWAATTDRSGRTCAVVHSGETYGDQWPGSRGIAIAKAFTANAYSLPDFALSTANLFWPTQPENALFGLVEANPQAPAPVLVGEARQWGTREDPAVGERVGGTVVFGGGLALYTSDGELVGALGLSGDQSCTDHVIAWKVRHALNLDNVPAGVTEADNDNIIHDLTTDPATGEKRSASGYGHPTCSPGATAAAREFSETAPTGPEP